MHWYLCASIWKTCKFRNVIDLSSLSLFPMEQSDVIWIVTSQLKTNDVAAENKRRRSWKQTTSQLKTNDVAAENERRRSWKRTTSQLKTNEVAAENERRRSWKRTTSQLKTNDVAAENERRRSWKQTTSQLKTQTTSQLKTNDVAAENKRRRSWKQTTSQLKTNDVAAENKRRLSWKQTKSQLKTNDVAAENKRRRSWKQTTSQLKTNDVAAENKRRRSWKQTTSQLKTNDVAAENKRRRSLKQTTSQLKTNDVAAENKRRRSWKQTTSQLKTNAHDSRFELSNLCLFLCTQSSNAEKCTVLGCHAHSPDLNNDRKRLFFYFRWGTEVLKEGIWSGLFSAAYQNDDQYYDIGPLCHIIYCSLKGCFMSICLTLSLDHSVFASSSFLRSTDHAHNSFCEFHCLHKPGVQIVFSWIHYQYVFSQFPLSHRFPELSNERKNHEWKQTNDAAHITTEGIMENNGRSNLFSPSEHSQFLRCWPSDLYTYWWVNFLSN